MKAQQHFIDIEVRLVSDDSLELMGEGIQFTDLQTKLSFVLAEQPMVYRIVLLSSMDVDYAVYSRVFQTIRESINQRRNSMAIKQYQLSYADLNPVERNEIRMLYPYRWIEKTMD